MKKIKVLLFVAIIAVSVACIAVVVYFAVAGRAEAEKLATATDAFRKGDYSAAYPRLLEIVRKDPSNAEAFRMLGAIDESKHNYPAALQHYQQARGLSPLDPELKTKYLEMLSAIGDFPTLLNTFRSEFEQNRLSPAETFCYLEAMIAAGKNEKETIDALEKWKGPADRRAYLKGLLEFKKNRPAEALKTLREIPKTALPFPAYCRLLAIRGAAFQAGGETAAAEETFRQLAKASPENGTFLLAQFYKRIGQDKQYREQLIKLVKEYPQQLAAVIELAELYAADKNLDALTALKRNPRNRTEVEIFSYIDAMRAFLEQRYSEAVKSLAVASMFSGRPLYQAIRLMSLIATKKVDQIPECANALLKISPSPESRRQILTDLGPLLLELIREKKVQEAFRISELVLSISNETSPIHTVAQEVLLQEAIAAGNITKATGYAAALLKDNPELVSANLAMSSILLAEGKPKEALAGFRRISAGNATAALGEARACLALKQPEEAEKAFRLALKLSPSSLEAFESYALFLIDRKRGGEIDAYLPGLPDTPEARFLVASVRAKRAEAEGKADEVKRYNLEALAELEKMPAGPAVNYQRAYLYALTGQDAKAEPIYEKLLIENPRQLMVLLNLSEVKAALGKKQEAMNLAERAIRLDPDSPLAKQCLRRRQIDMQK